MDAAPVPPQQRALIAIRANLATAKLAAFLLHEEARMPVERDVSVALDSALDAIEREVAALEALAEDARDEPQ